MFQPQWSVETIAPAPAVSQAKMKIFEIPGAEDHMFPVKQADQTAEVIDDWPPPGAAPASMDA
jgi:hypothetical protein